MTSTASIRFEKVTANNITLDSLSPYIAADGCITSWLRYNLAWRRDQIGIDNRDLLQPVKSWQGWTGVNSPKATLNLVAPQIAAAAIGCVQLRGGIFHERSAHRKWGCSRNGGKQGAFVSDGGFEDCVRDGLSRDNGQGHAGASLAKIDPDTGLQFDHGPSRNRYVTAVRAPLLSRWNVAGVGFESGCARFSFGMPIPEAPRLIVDVLGTYDRLPFRLQARAEFEEVGRKPLGDGFRSVPVREFRGALVRSFRDGRMEAGVHFLIASGYTGQTTEVLALPGEGEPFERVVGVRMPSYVTVSYTMHFK